MAAEQRLLCRAKALYPYTANDGSSVSFERGDVIDVLAQLPSGWWDGLCKGVRGWFPSNYVEITEVYNDSTTNSTNSHRATMNSMISDSTSSHRPSSQQSRATQLFDDQLEQGTTDTSLPSSSWTIEKADKGAFYYNQRTGEMLTIDSDDPVLLEDEDDDDDDMLSDLETNEGDMLSLTDSRQEPSDYGQHRIDTTSSATGDEYDSDWMVNDENLQLPAPWVKRPVSQGGSCFYNMTTHEIVWDINDITDHPHDTTARNGSSERPLELPKPQPRSPARKMTIRRGSVISLNEPLTWKKLSIHVALAVHNLNIAARNSNTSSFEPYCSAIVDAIRFMLLASGTVDKDAVYLRTHTVLRTHHRTMMASLSKLILSSHACAYNPTDGIAKMLADSNELLLATRNFISTGESIPVSVHHIEPQLQDVRRPSTNDPNLGSSSNSNHHRNSNTSTTSSMYHRRQSNNNQSMWSSASGAYRSKYTLDGDFAESVETYGNSMQESVDGMMNSVTTYKQQWSHNMPLSSSPPPSLSAAEATSTMSTSAGSTAKRSLSLDSPKSALIALLFSQFRNFSNQAGQFLSIFDEVDFHGFQSPELDELDLLRQQLYQGVGDFFCKLQTMTDEDVPLNDSTQFSAQDGTEIKQVIQAICHCVDKLVFDPTIRQQNCQNSDIPESSMFGAAPTSTARSDHWEEDDMDNDSYYTDAVTSSNYGPLSARTPTEHDSPFQSPANLDQVPDAKAGSYVSAHRHSSNDASSHGTSTSPHEGTSLQRKPSTSPDHPRQSNAKLKKFFGDDIPERISHTPPAAGSEQGTTVAGGPPGVAVDGGRSDGGGGGGGGDVPREEERPWYLQYDYRPNEIVFNMEGSVKGGTLMALVIRLTLHDYLDMNFINTFLLTYRSFCSSMELLKLLEKRYTTAPPEELTEQELEIWMNKKLKLIRLRVFNVLKNWLEQYYNEDDYVILDELMVFTTTTIRSTLRFSAEQLERLIKKRQEATGDGLKKMVLTLPTAPPVPILPRNRKKFRLLDIDALELARQMTIIDFKLYSSILPVECLNKAWSKDPSDEKGKVAVHIRASIEYCNQVTSWVSDSILSQPEVKKRVTLIKHWVQIAERCRQLNNFNTCMAILSAFDNSAVGRLKRTWEMVGARTNHILSQIRKLMGANRNFTEYRAIIHSVNPPCIPFLGIYLQDLTFIEDGNSDFLKTSKDMINFAKRAKTAEVIREIEQYQSTHYQLIAVDELQAFIQTNLQSTRDEEQLYNESLKLEPREREDEKITRLLQESGFL